MSNVLLVPLVVLVAGLAAGLAVAFALARRSSRLVSTDDGSLVLNDLEARRDELYERLREEDLSEEERENLELSAAMVLRELEALGVTRSKKPAQAAARSERETPVEERPATTGGFRHPLLVGFLLGGGMVALVATLVAWAVRDASPGSSAAAAGPPPAASASEAPFDRGEPPLAPEVASQVRGLEARIDTEPDNLLLKKQLAHLLLTHGQLFESFRWAQEILAADADDPDGNYVAGVVRLTMGQPEDALRHLERALASAPQHSPAAMMQGLILLQLNRRDEALAAWRRGLEAAGGQHQGLQHVIALAEQGLSAEEILAAPPE